MRIRMANRRRTGAGGWAFWGYRELRPSYIKEVLSTMQKEPDPKPRAGNPKNPLLRRRVQPQFARPASAGAFAHSRPCPS